ncbi:MAG: hypothetical protein AAGA23_09560 [Pseudomonadota bacterium]
MRCAVPVAAALLVAFCARSAAQADGPDTLLSESTADETAIEETVVVGQKPLITLRREFEAAHREMVAIFNELNLEREYQIICRKERRIRSQILYEICRPRFLWEAEAAAFEAFSGGVEEGVFKSDMDKKKNRLYAKFVSFAKDNGAFRAAAAKRKAAKDAFEAARAR